MQIAVNFAASANCIAGNKQFNGLMQSNQVVTVMCPPWE